MGRFSKYAIALGRLGGLARKNKYSKEELSVMGKKGGRPRKLKVKSESISNKIKIN